MVLKPTNFNQRDGRYPRKDGFGDSSRPQADQQPVQHKPLSIKEALRESCGFDIKDFILIFNDGYDQEKVYTSTSLSNLRHKIVTEQFKQDFRRGVAFSQQPESAFRSANTSFGSNSHAYGEFEQDGIRESRKHSTSSSSGRRHRQQQRQKSSDSEDELASLSRKRARLPRPSEAPARPKLVNSVRVDNDEEIEKLYFVRFADMQQYACKIMGKAFVKLVEPKKQTHHPYTKGDDNCPDWWPSPKGENAVRHKEPDHLLKKERIRLLVHILRLVMQPRDKQMPCIQKNNLNVQRLEEVTLEAMTTFFNDREKPGNAEKRGYLRDIFKVAKQEEEYLRGEMDGTTKIMHDYGAENCVDDTEEDEGDADIYNGEEEPVVENAVLTPQSLPLVSPTLTQGPSSHQMHHHQQQQQMSEIEAQQRHQPLVVRPHQAHFQRQIGFDESYGRGIDIGFQPTQSPTLADPNRREFYSSNQPTMNHWQGPMMSNAPPNNNNYFAVSPTNLPPLNQTVMNPAMLPLPNNQSQMPPPHMAQGFHHHAQYDRDYSQGNSHGHPMRTASLPAYGPPQLGYEPYQNYADPHDDDHNMKHEQQHMGGPQN